MKNVQVSIEVCLACMVECKNVHKPAKCKTNQLNTKCLQKYFVLF